MSRLLHAPLLGAARLGVGLFGVLAPRRAAGLRFDLWLEPWLSRRLEMGGRPPAVPPGTTRDLLFCFVDHFEPGTKGASLERARERFAAWTERYPPLARRFADAEGRHPQHGFFLPPHYFREEYLLGLAAMDWQGVGETELHLHHEHDTSASLRALLEETLERYADYGVFQCQGDPVRRAYGFIHGNWALDNSRPEFCGVNDELTILRETGCYGDFTFPSLYAAQPRRVNALYRAIDDPAAPKSYDFGPLMQAGRRPAPGEFAMFTGPIGLRGRRRFPFFSVEDADVTGEGPGTPARVRGWVNEGIHVAGRPEWIVVKVHTHGAPERHRDALLGEGAARLFETLCTEFGDGERWRLHFVNARELYNIARAAEDGLSGNAGDCRDYELPPYLTRAIRCNRRYRAERFVPAAAGGLPALSLRVLEPAADLSLELRGGLRALRGPLATLALSPAGEGAWTLEASAAGELELELAGNLQLRGAGEPAAGEAGGRRWRLPMAGDGPLRATIHRGGERGE
jgi:hypothetical protein